MQRALLEAAGTSQAVGASLDEPRSATSDNRFRIVELGKYFPPEYQGGVEVTTEMSSIALSDAYDVTVICHNLNSRTAVEKRAAFSVIRCGTQFKRYSQPISLSMGFALWKAAPDLIHFHAPNFWGALMIMLFSRRTPLIITHHHDVEGRALLRRLLLPLYHRLVRNSKSVIVTSTKNAQISADLPGKLNRVVAIPLAVDERAFILDDEQKRDVAEAKRREFGDRIVVGFVGRLVWYKGLSILLRAIASLPNCTLLLIGTGPLEEAVRREAQAIGVADRVRFVGRITHLEKVKYLNSMDLFVLPSTHITEAFGISQIEAMMCGVPIISTDLPTGVSDVNVHGETGLVVKAGDVESLRAAIDRLAADSELRKRYGAAGYERAVRLFSQEVYLENLRAEVARCLAH